MSSSSDGSSDLSLELEEMRCVHRKISPYVPPTPLIRSQHLSQKYCSPIYLKLENLNISGSFKVRGATAALLSYPIEKLRAAGVVVASAGNHGQGVAYISQALGVPATVFMPENTPLIKVEATRSYGAEVILTGKTFHEAQREMLAWRQDHENILIHAFNQRAVVLGQSTVGLEIIEEQGDLGAVVVPVGGGGLISGVSSAVKALNPQALVVGVQSQRYCPVTRMMKSLGKSLCSVAGCEEEAFDVGADAVLADGIAVKEPGTWNQELIRRRVDLMSCAAESAVAGAIMELLERDHIAVEGAGAVAVAALDQLFSHQAYRRGKPTVCILSGGNIDAAVLSRITRKGLVYTERMMRLQLTLRDSPGALAQLLSRVAEGQANLYHIHHSRIFSDHGVKEARVTLDLEIAHSEHGEKVLRHLREAGYEVQQQDLGAP